MSTPTPDYPDWTTPVAIVEKDTIAIPLTSFTSGIPSATIDTSAAQELTIHLNYIGILPQLWSLQLTWFIGGNPRITEGAMVLLDIPHNNSLQQVDWRLPVKGSGLQIRLTDDTGAGTIFAEVALTNRPLQGAAWSSDLTFAGKMFLRQFGFTVNAGATQTFILPPTENGFGAWILGGVAGMAYRFNALAMVAGVPTLSRTITIGSVAADTTYAIPFPPHSGGRLDITNTTGGNIAISIAVWDVSP